MLASMADMLPREDFSAVAMYAFCLLSGWWLTRWVILNYVNSPRTLAHAKKMEDLDSQQQVDVSSKMSEKKRTRRQAKKAPSKAAMATDGAGEECTKPIASADAPTDADEDTTLTLAPTSPNLSADANESQIDTADGDLDVHSSSAMVQPELESDLPEGLQNQSINCESSSERKTTRLGSGSRRRAKKAACKAAISTCCAGEATTQPIASDAHQSELAAETANDSTSSNAPEVSADGHTDMSSNLTTAEATNSKIDTADGDLEFPTLQSETDTDFPDDSQHQSGKCEISSSEEVLTSASGKENCDDMDGSSSQSSADVQVSGYKLDWNDPLWESSEPPCLRFTTLPDDDDEEEDEEEQEEYGTAEVPAVAVSNGPVYMPVGFINQNQEYIAFMEPPSEQIGGVFLEPAILQKVVIDPAMYDPASFYPAECQSEHSPSERQMQAPAPGWSPASSEADWAGLGERRGVQSSHSGDSWRSSFSRDDWGASNRSTPQRYYEQNSASPCNSWNNQVQHWDQPWGM